MRNIRWTVLVLGFLILFVGMNCGHAGESEEVSETGLSKEEKKLIEAGLKPFEPKLLWEKRFKGQISHLDLAKESGDVIVSADDIYLFNKKGRLLWKQGTIEEIHDPWNGHISDDGEVITYDVVDWETYFTVVFYVDRNNKEKWHKAVPGASYLSPDGSWVVVAPSAGTGSSVVILNDRGEVVRKKEYYWSGQADVRFSEDSRYVGTMDVTTVHDKNIYWIFGRSGDLVLEFRKEFGEGLRSFTSNGLFSINEAIPEEICNLDGKTVITGDTINLSGDGKLAVKIEWKENTTGLQVIQVPSLELISSYQLPPLNSPYPLNISFKGRYVILGSSEVSSRKVWIVDTKRDQFWKAHLIIPSEKNLNELSPRFPWSQGVFFTKDEEHMVVHLIGEGAVHILRYYELQ